MSQFEEGKKSVQFSTLTEAGDCRDWAGASMRMGKLRSPVSTTFDGCMPGGVILWPPTFSSLMYESMKKSVPSTFSLNTTTQLWNLLLLHFDCH